MSLYIVMGVTGCGKSTVAQLLAEKTSGTFLDADDFHPFANKEKMSNGIPLTDEDRWGWLHILNHELVAREAQGQTVFLACSALRQVYRERLATGLRSLRIIYLHGSRELIAYRLAQRKDHFMSPSLLDSQFATLETPTDALVAEIDDPISVIVEKILSKIE